MCQENDSNNFILEMFRLHQSDFIPKIFRPFLRTITTFFPSCQTLFKLHVTPGMKPLRPLMDFRLEVNCKPYWENWFCPSDPVCFCWIRFFIFLTRLEISGDSQECMITLRQRLIGSVMLKESLFVYQDRMKFFISFFSIKPVL